jgi:hypothetical protein
MDEAGFGEGFDRTLAALPAGDFSTADFVVEYRKSHAEEWAGIERQFGAGGKGAGQHHTAFTRVAHRLSKLARTGELHKLDYRVAPDWWGNGVVQYWTLDPQAQGAALPGEDEDAEFREGSLQFKTHLRRERAWGLSKKKKAAFRAQHGKLFCQRCGLEPEREFGERLGSAVIEVHHAAVAVGAMQHDHRTRLSDLQCLCANCHRLTHAEFAA